MFSPICIFSGGILLYAIVLYITKHYYFFVFSQCISSFALHRHVEARDEVAVNVKLDLDTTSISL